MLAVLAIASQLLVAQSATSAHKFWQSLEKQKDYIEFLARHQQPDAAVSASMRLLLARQIEPLLHTYHSGLTYEFGGLGTNEVELVISADGNRKNIPAVRRLVRAAPAWDRWKIVAFRPRLAVISGDFLFEQEVFDTARIWYRQHKRGGKVDVELYFEHTKRLQRKQLIGPAFILLDLLVGEYVVITKIGQISPQRIKVGQRPVDVKPITRFAAEFERLTGKELLRPDNGREN